MKIGSDVPEVTWMALRCVFRLGMARPSPMPTAIARMIHNGKNRSRNDNRAMTGASDVAPLGGRSETTSLTASLQSKLVEGSTARGPVRVRQWLQPGRWVVPPSSLAAGLLPDWQLPHCGCVDGRGN